MKKLLWIDLEMTGLNPEIHHIIEIAAIVTDLDFNALEEFHRVIYQPPEALSLMDDWCKKTHGDSGLTKAIPGGTPLAQAEEELLALIGRHFSKKDRPVLAGNSVGNDKAFIDRHMKQLSARLHYRIVDVSSFKEIFREKYKIEVKKENAHRAVDDIKESIKELRHYLSFVKVASP